MKNSKARDAGDSELASALAHSRGLDSFMALGPGADAPGFTLSPAPRVHIERLRAKSEVKYHASEVDS